MTDRERMLKSIAGEAPDRIAWVPRLEFWYRARMRNGTLPAEVRGLSMMEIAEKLGAGYYSIVPDFTECPGELDMIDRALGIFRLDVLPYRAELDGTDRRILKRGKETVVEYHTPVGSIHTTTFYTEEMLDAGASVPWTNDHAIRKPEDFDTLAWIFSRIRVTPQREGYRRMRERVGERGIVIGYVSGTACPIHLIMKELMPLDQFFFALHDYPEKVEMLVEAMMPYYLSMQECAADSTAEVVLLGGNYDDSITYPAFYRKHILPHLRDFAGQLHSRGKYLITHTDGENRKLLKLYLETDFDVADSVCPYPMTSVKLEEFIEAFKDRITVVGGIPAVLLCKDSASMEDCRNFIEPLIERYGRVPRFILGVSDMVTADCEWDRLLYVSERVTR